MILICRKVHCFKKKSADLQFHDVNTEKKKEENQFEMKEPGDC